MTESPPAYRSIDDLNHDPKLAEALGHMVVAWSNAERVLQNVIMCVTDMDPNMTAAAYYSIPTFESRAKFIQALLREWQTEDYDKDAIGKELDGLRSLSVTRNHWVHGFWCVSLDSKETVIFDYRKERVSERRRKPVKATDVTFHVHAVQHRAIHLATLVPLPSVTEHKFPPEELLMD